MSNQQNQPYELHEALRTLLSIDRAHNLSAYVGHGSGSNFADALELTSALETVRTYLVVNAPETSLPARPSIPEFPVYREAPLR